MFQHFAFDYENNNVINEIKCIYYIPIILIQIFLHRNTKQYNIFDTSVYWINLFLYFNLVCITKFRASL